MMSLARAFNTMRRAIPAQVPYLAPDPADAARWQERLKPDERPLVGLVWAGNPSHANDRNRSLPAAALPPLLAQPGVRFLSLQTGSGHAGLGACDVEDVMDGVRDFADTAALIANLDLLVSVDTAPLHLAGALARPALGLIAYAPDWRWQLERTDSPWYPTLRLLRQSKPGDWGTVLDAVRLHLREALAGKNRPGKSEP